MILHMDMDAFFASVEQLDNPALKGKCVIVGGRSRRSVVATASYEARKYGIHSAMPIFMAKQKCPGIIIVPPRKNRYKELSLRIMKLLNDFSPLVEPVSIDEAYIDITGCERLHGKPAELALKIKKKIKNELNLTCSVGIGQNKFIAKIASDMNKPDGFTIIAPDKTAGFIKFLSIEKVPGVGKATYKQLEILGIKTLGDVKKCSKEMLIQKFGKFGQRLLNLSLCIDNSPVIPDTFIKSVSHEETLSKDTDDRKLLDKYLLKHSEDVGRQLRKQGVKSKTITLKIKQSDFTQITKSVTMPSPTQSSEVIYHTAKKLLEAYNIIQKVRLIGIGASKLVSVDTPAQMALFNGDQKKGRKWEQVEKTVDCITKKFGQNSIKKANINDHLSGLHA